MARAEDGAKAVSPEAQVRALYEKGETDTAKAFEDLVAKPSFGRVLALSTENIASLVRIGADFADLVLRNLRIAGRADMTRLGRQLHRTEDKLERVLQEVEQLRDELRHQQADGSDAGRSSGTGRGTSRRPEKSR
ncbi:MAG TPA: hypothetical protein VFB39_14535 [Solirubrobacteraceae bacterium]|nr:hypothetical protein [Solirubrobacteraceae bacterium]